MGTMGTEVDRNEGTLPNSSEDDLRSLEEDYAALRDETNNSSTSEPRSRQRCGR